MRPPARICHAGAPKRFASARRRAWIRVGACAQCRRSSAEFAALRRAGSVRRRQRRRPRIDDTWRVRVWRGWVAEEMAQPTADPTAEDPLTEMEMELQLEEDALRLAIRAARQRRSATRQRAATFWDRVHARQEEDDLWLEAQKLVWAEQRGMLEQACLEPLGTIASELRRFQAEQRAAHDRKCAQVKARQEVEQGNLHWALFCARLAHDSFGALSAVPLTTEQVRACDAAVQHQLQPRAKAKDPRAFTVLRAAAISLASGTGGISARSTRGLVCSELCQTREHLDGLLMRLLSTVLASAEGVGTGAGAGAGASSAAGVGMNAPGQATSVPTPAAAAAAAAMPGSPARMRGGTGNSASGNGSATTSAARSAHLGSGRCAAAVAAGKPAEFQISLPGKRMPLFPRSMRLSSDCLGWLHATERTASDPHVYFLAEEMDAPPRQRASRGGAGARRPDDTTNVRSLAEQLVASAEVAAISIAGADLQVLLPDSDGEDCPHLHLRPASVEHLLAVECLWPEMDPADREVLTSCYTPRETPHACMLSTLYVPLADTPHAESEKLGSARRLRPLRQHELQELLRVYVVRKPKPTAATLSLPLVPPNDARVRELRTHDGDEVFEHLYCTASAPSTGTGIAYILQLVPARESPEPAAEDADTDAAETSQLVELVQSGAFYDAMQAATATFKLRAVGLQPPSHAVTCLEASLASAQKARNAHAELTAAISKEVSELRDSRAAGARRQ